MSRLFPFTKQDWLFLGFSHQHLWVHWHANLPSSHKEFALQQVLELASLDDGGGSHSLVLYTEWVCDGFFYFGVCFYLNSITTDLRLRASKFLRCESTVKGWEVWDWWQPTWHWPCILAQRGLIAHSLISAFESKETVHLLNIASRHGVRDRCLTISHNIVHNLLRVLKLSWLSSIPHKTLRYCICSISPLCVSAWIKGVWHGEFAGFVKVCSRHCRFEASFCVSFKWGGLNG
mgnify:CR=1 FL=1